MRAETPVNYCPESPFGPYWSITRHADIQAVEARMPQLKKIVLAMGNRLIYRDTFEQALEELTGEAPGQRPAAPVTTTSATPPTRNWPMLSL